MGETLVEVARESASERIPEDLPGEVREVFTDALGGALDQEWIENDLILVIDDLLAYTKGDQESLTTRIQVACVRDEFADGLTQCLSELFPEGGLVLAPRGASRVQNASQEPSENAPRSE